MLRQWRSAALRCRAKWRFHRREAVGKQLLNAAGESIRRESIGESIANRLVVSCWDLRTRPPSSPSSAPIGGPVSQVLTTVSLLLHYGFTRPYLSQFHHCKRCLPIARRRCSPRLLLKLLSRNYSRPALYSLFIYSYSMLI